jgi:hypothetical protein
MGYRFSTSSRPVEILVIALIALGVSLTLWLFYPGVMTFDAGWILEDIKNDRVPGDWQSPVMAAVWSALIPIIPGRLSMFLLLVVPYWLAFAILALRVAQYSPICALALPLLALTPPAFLILGVIWRDVIMANSWLLAVAIAWTAAEASNRLRLPLQGAGIILIIFGLLLRPNAIFAAPFLVAYVIWPASFEWRRAIILYLPALVGGLGLIHLVFYEVLGAERQHVTHAILVFDLGGISHFTGQNQFPVQWSQEEESQIVEKCYDPSQWDTYWTFPPCPFVMQRLHEEKLFGTPNLFWAWVAAVSKHPVAYMQHRFSHFIALMTTGGRTADFETLEPVNMSGPSLKPLIAINNFLKWTIVFRVGPWFFLVVVVSIIAWRHRRNPAGAFAFAVSMSAVFYLATFLVLGVASEFRYAYWSVLAGLTGFVAILIPELTVAGSLGRPDRSIR